MPAGVSQPLVGRTSGVSEIKPLDSGVTVDRENRYIDDGIITSAGVAAGIDMTFYVVEQFCGGEVVDETAHYIEYPRT